MEGEIDREERNKEKHSIMMDQEENHESLQKGGTKHTGRPYQYKINRKKRVVAKREGLENDKEEAKDLHAAEHIEEILHATYEINNSGVMLSLNIGSLPLNWGILH
jgi:hypothetical protein